MLLTAREACARRKFKPASLYAYGSRGLIRSAETPGRSERRYDANDVERLRRRPRGGRARSAPLSPFDADRPVLESALSLVEGGRIYYRGQAATGLARHADLEGVARLLWGVADYADPFVTAGLPPGIHPVLARLPAAPQ